MTTNSTPDLLSHADDRGDGVLDNPVWHGLIGPHERFAQLGPLGGELVRRYPPEVSPFLGVREWDAPRVWDDLQHLCGPGQPFVVSGDLPQPPRGWHTEWRGTAVQLVETDRLEARPDAQAIELGDDDVHEVLGLVERNRPGPFAARTHELGRYLGIRIDGRLAAMAGERMHPEGWVEISAVSTDAAFRRRGLASRLVLDLVHDIRARGQRAMMHAAIENETAIAGYLKLGFELRRHTEFASFRTPEA